MKRQIILLSMIPFMLGNTNAEQPQIDVVQAGVTEQSIPEKIDDLYDRVQQLDNKVNAIVNQYEQISQEHSQYSQKLNNIEQSQNVLQNEITQLQLHPQLQQLSTGVTQSNQAMGSNENPIVQSNTPVDVSVKEVLEKYPDIAKTINKNDMENYLKGEVPFPPSINEEILSKATSNDIADKLQNPNISQEEKQLILQQHPEILQILGNPSNINQYLDGNVPFPPQFKDELSQKILANNIVDKLNNPQTSPQERQEILQQHPEIMSMTNISPDQYQDYVNGKIPFPPTLKDSLSQKSLVDDTPNALNNQNVSPQEKQPMNYKDPTTSNMGSDSITNVNNNNNQVLYKDNQQNTVQNNVNPSQSNSNYTKLSKDDSFAVNPDEKFARQNSQNIFNELKNANTIDERKAVFDKYPNELNFVNPSDKMKYISGDLPIDQSFYKQLTDNAIQNYNIPVYNSSSLFDSNNNTEQLKDNDINEMLNKLQNASTQDEKINIIEEYPQFKQVVQKYMVNGTPLDINSIRNELLQNKNQYNYNNDVDLTTLSAKQLIDELQKCKDTCKLLQNQYQQTSQEIPEPVVEQTQIMNANNIINPELPGQPVKQDLQPQDVNLGIQLSNEQQIQSENEVSNHIEPKQILPNTIGIQDNISINSEQRNISNNGSVNSIGIEEQNNNNSEILTNSNLLDNDSLGGVSNEASIDSNNISSQTNNTALDGDVDEEFKQIQVITNALKTNSN